MLITTFVRSFWFHAYLLPDIHLLKFAPPPHQFAVRRAKAFATVVLYALLFGMTAPTFAAIASTTTLTITSAGNSVSSVASGTAITLNVTN
jgi:hypothetical protein